MLSESIRPSRTPATEADLMLFQQIEEQLYTAVISDALDELGIRNQALREFIRPLSADDRFAGWARTLSYVDVYHVPPAPYAMEIEAIDSILPGEVVMAIDSGVAPECTVGRIAIDGGARARRQRSGDRRSRSRCQKDSDRGVSGICAGYQTCRLQGKRHDYRLQRAG